MMADRILYYADSRRHNESVVFVRTYVGTHKERKKERQSINRYHFKIK